MAWMRGVLLLVVMRSAHSQWASMPPLPSARSNPFVAAVGSRVYVFGGYGEDSAALSGGGYFRPSTSSYTTCPPMPRARYGGGAAAIGSVMYVIGGSPYGYEVA